MRKSRGLWLGLLLLGGCTVVPWRGVMVQDDLPPPVSGAVQVTPAAIAAAMSAASAPASTDAPLDVAGTAAAAASQQNASAAAKPQRCRTVKAYTRKDGRHVPAHVRCG